MTTVKLSMGVVLLSLVTALPLCADKRPEPLKNLEVSIELDAGSYGAVPDDGKNDWKALSMAFEDMSRMLRENKSAAVRLNIPPGVYDIKSQDKDNPFCFSLERISGFEINAAGAVFMMGSPVQSLLSIRKCSNGIIRGLGVDYSVLPFTQGRIRSVSVDDRSFVFVPDSGYPALDDSHFLTARQRWGSVFEEDGSCLKAGMPNLVPVLKISDIGDGSFRVVTTPPVASMLVSGDRIAIIARYNGLSTYSVTDSRQISFVDDTNYAGPAGGFSSRNSMVNVIGCRVIKKLGRLISQNADCVHVVPARYGPWIEGCTFEGQQDDAVNIKTELLHIVSRSAPDRFLVTGVPLAGDRLRLFEPVKGEMLGWFNVVSVERKTGNLCEIVTDAGFDGELVCGKDKACAMFFNDSKANRGFVIKDNIFRNSRRYAMLIQAVDGVISGNRMEDISTAAVVLQNSAAWPEGFVPRNVRITGNYIRNCGFDTAFEALGELAAPVMMATNVCNARNGEKPSVWKGIEDIIFDDNTVIAPASAAVYLSGVRNSCIVGNVFDTVHSPAVVKVNCENISEVPGT